MIDRDTAMLRALVNMFEALSDRTDLPTQWDACAPHDEEPFDPCASAYRGIARAKSIIAGEIKNLAALHHPMRENSLDHDS